MNDFEWIRSQLETFTTNGKRDPHANNELFSRAESLFFSNDFTEFHIQKLFAIFGGNPASLQKAYAHYINRKEYDLAQRMLSLPLPDLLAHPHITTREPTIRKEISSSSISSDDHVLMIGSGPLPLTAILYNKYARCRITCFEIVPEFMEISKKLIRHLGLSDTIEIVHKCGTFLTSDRYSVINIALLAQPKDKILKAITTTAKKGTRVICRTSSGFESIFYGTTDTILFKQFVVDGRDDIIGTHLHYLRVR